MRTNSQLELEGGEGEQAQKEREQTETNNHPNRREERSGQPAGQLRTLPLFFCPGVAAGEVLDVTALDEQ